MAEHDRNLAVLYRIAQDNPELAKMLDERQQDQDQYRDYQTARRLGAEGLTLETAPDLRERQEAALGYLQAINDAADDIAKATAPQMSPIIEAVFKLYGEDIGGRSGVNKSKVTELGDIVDDSIAERSAAQDNIYGDDLAKFPALQGEVREILGMQQSDPLALANVVYDGLQNTSTAKERAAILSYVADESGYAANDLQEILITNTQLDPTKQAVLGRVFDEVGTDVQQNLQNLDRANRRVQAATSELLSQYGGMTGAQRAFLEKIQKAVLGEDDAALRQAVGLERVEGLPETEASKKMREIVDDMIKLPEGVDYWQSDVQHVADILASPAFMEAAEKLGYSGPPREVLRRVTQNYEGDVGEQRRQDDLLDSYRILNQGQPAGSVGRWVKALVTRIMNHDDYSKLKSRIEGTSVEQARTEDRQTLPQTPEAVQEAVQQGVDQVEQEVQTGVEAPPEPAETRREEAAPRPPDLPSEGTVSAMQRMADAQGQPLPIGQSGLFVQPGQEGKLFQPGEGQEGELVEYTPPTPEAAAPGAEAEGETADREFTPGQQAELGRAFAEGGGLLPTSRGRAGGLARMGQAAEEMPEAGEPRTGTDGVFNYTLDPDGTVRFTRRGREIRVTADQPGPYYAILEKAFGEAIPERAQGAVDRARARLEGRVRPAAPAGDGKRAGQTEEFAGFPYQADVTPGEAERGRRDPQQITGETDIFAAVGSGGQDAPPSPGQEAAPVSPTPSESSPASPEAPAPAASSVDYRNMSVDQLKETLFDALRKGEAPPFQSEASAAREAGTYGEGLYSPGSSGYVASDLEKKLRQAERLAQQDFETFQEAAASGRENVRARVEEEPRLTTRQTVETMDDDELLALANNFEDPRGEAARSEANRRDQAAINLFQQGLVSYEEAQGRMLRPRDFSAADATERGPTDNLMQTMETADAETLRKYIESENEEFSLAAKREALRRDENVINTERQGLLRPERDPETLGTRSTQDRLVLPDDPQNRRASAVRVNPLEIQGEAPPAPEGEPSAPPTPTGARNAAIMQAQGEESGSDISLENALALGQSEQPVEEPPGESVREPEFSQQSEQPRESAGGTPARARTAPSRRESEEEGTSKKPEQIIRRGGGTLREGQQDYRGRPPGGPARPENMPGGTDFTDPEKSKPAPARPQPTTLQEGQQSSRLPTSAGAAAVPGLGQAGVGGVAQASRASEAQKKIKAVMESAQQRALAGNSVPGQF